MTKQTTLRLAALLLPALLAFIAVMGELNRLQDRSAPAEVFASADAIQSTPYAGPRLRLSAEILEPRDVDEKTFPVGSEVLLRYSNAEGDWTFSGARAPGESRWGASEIDVPARVERVDIAGRVRAVPLVPTDFAIPEKTVSRIRHGARVRLALRRGALGNVWVESAVQTSDALGSVVALVELHTDPRLHAVGVSEAALDSRNFVRPGSSGWIAPLEDFRIADVTELPGRPIRAVALSDGRIAVATGAATSPALGFEVSIRAPDGKEIRASRHYGGTLVELEPDGWVWSREGSGTQTLIRSDLSGSVTSRIPLSIGRTILGVRESVLAAGSSSVVARYRIDGNALVEIERWTLEEMQSAALLSPVAIAAIAGRSVYLLKTGVKEPELVFVAQHGGSVSVVRGDANGNLLIGVRPAREPGVYRAYSISKHVVFYRLAGGTVTQLGELSVDKFPWSSSGAADSGLLLRNGLLYFAFGGQIAVFDLAEKKLKAQVRERAGGRLERIL